MEHLNPQSNYPGKVPRIAVLITDSFGEPFTSIKSDVHPYAWSSVRNFGVDIYYARGITPGFLSRKMNQFSDKFRYTKIRHIQRIVDFTSLFPHLVRLPKTKLTSNLHIQTDVPEGLRFLGLKVLSCLSYLMDQGYDVVYKTTLSSVVNPARFLSEITLINLDVPYYGGTRVTRGDTQFVSGANLLLNRKTISILIENRLFLNPGELDDVSFGRFLRKRVKITEILSENIQSVVEVETADTKNTTHFRCKSNSIPRNDAIIMRQLLNKLERSRTK
jgi:hypothetical protein